MFTEQSLQIRQRNQSVLESIGLPSTTNVAMNWSSQALIAAALEKGEGVLTDKGALMCDTGTFTGRSPKDKFIVEDELTSDPVWWGEINQPFSPDAFDLLHQQMLDFLAEKSVYVRYVNACSVADSRLSICVINTLAWHNLFCHHLFLRPTSSEIADFSPEWTILNIPEFEADPLVHGTRKGNFTIINFTKKVILIGGTAYAGEMKKGIFSVLNFTLPRKGILSMHCSANIGAQTTENEADTALFFGLSGTGKTTLSADVNRRLIGDDEHGWADQIVFNIEGGCYAKVVNLSQEGEPEIYQAIRPGSILENTRFYEGTDQVDYANNVVTDNTRAAYPIDFISNFAQPSLGASPKNIFFLTADAFGVLPPIAKLTTQQAMYYFMSGFTSKVAGTEVGIKEPVPTFSACFGAAFLPLHPSEYANLLGSKLKSQQVQVWLVNTGWVAGAYGTGSRISLKYTRSLINAVLNGDLQHAEYQTIKPFGLAVPLNCPGVPDNLLNPRESWSEPAEYDLQALKLAAAFQVNFQQYQHGTDEAILEAGPHLED